MLTKETKQKIDSARDILVGQLPLPSDQVELITITLIYKFMNDMDEELKEISGEPQFFKGKLKKVSWKEITSDKKNPAEKLELFAEGIKEIQSAEHIQRKYTKGYEDYRLTYSNRVIKNEDKINWGDLLKPKDKKILELEQKWNEQLNQFFTMLGIKELTTKNTKNTKDLFQDQSELKQWFDTELKEKAIAYGTLSFVAHKDSYLEVSSKYPLSKEIKKELDDAREFNIPLPPLSIQEEIVREID